MKKVADVVMNEYVWCSRSQRSAEALAGTFRVKVFCRAEPGKSYPMRHNGIRLDVLNLVTRSWPRWQWVQAVKYLEYCVRTFFRVLAYHPDIVYCHDVFTLPVAVAFKLLGRTVVYDAHEYWADTEHMHQYNARLHRALYWLQCRSIRKFDLVITVGHCLADLMARDHGIPAPLLVPNTCRYEDLPPEPDIWRRHGIPDEARTVLYQGFFAPNRGLDELIASVPEWDPGIHLVMQGDGPLRAKLEKAVDRLGIRDRVTFTGMVPESEVSRYARACTVGIMPYKANNQNFYNVLPNKFFAYTINRRPVLASRFPQMERLIGEYHLGGTFNPDSPPDIARAVNEFIRGGGEIPGADHRRFVSEYAWEPVSRRLVEAVERVSK